MDTPTFPTLSARTGIDLPEALVRLMDGGRTDYGPAWREQWRGRCLRDPPALISCFDFEWIDAARSQEVIDGWLNPAWQAGRAFLPFAETGAGDSLCFVPFGAGQVGVALIRHDSDEGRIGHMSFSDFVCVQFLGVFADFGHLLGEEDGFTEAEALRIVRADVRQVAGCLDAAARDYLLPFCDLEPAHQPFSDGPRSRPRRVFSLISQERFAAEMRRFPGPALAPFPIAERWRIPRGGPRAGPEVVDWKTLALDPAMKMRAIRAYQAEHAVGLAAAKAAVEEHAARQGPGD